ncbi:MAG: hypothetical protein AMS21_04005 [Gemmatimonas sp. SG8_38_2]|nr:MAG: hypothetical protein AMS21_04005 [Gemmatimonas sp. SG8_38_2]
MTRGAAIEIVAVGDELLSGATVDSNSARIAEELEPLGLRVTRKTIVRDVPEAIVDAVAAALERAGAVITTGGLGPTRDDRTKSAVAEVFQRPLEFRDDLWSALQQRWARRGKIPETNRSQAEVPAGAVVLSNPRGTAPGLLVEDEQLGVCIMLPGPPHEMQRILLESVVPYFASQAEASAKRPFRRYLRTAGIAESAIAEQVTDGLEDLPLEVAYLPEIDGNDVRLTAWAVDESDVGQALDEGVRRLRGILGLHIYAEGTADLADVVGDLLKERGMTIAVAESCTGGLVAKRLTERPGASEYFWGGVVVYDDRAKSELLGVSEKTLKRFGAVSRETALEMAEGIAARSAADAAIAITGIAGPAGGGDAKEVGTVWLAVRVRSLAVAKRRYYPGTRDIVRMRAAQGGLDLLRRTLLGEPQ